MSKANPIVSTVSGFTINGRTFKDDAECLGFIVCETDQRKAINENLRTVVPVMFSRLCRPIVNVTDARVIRAHFAGFMSACKARKFSDAQVKQLIGLTDCDAESITTIRFSV